MTVPGFEYKNKKNETPFETFLRYSDEKEQSAVKLATVFHEKVNGPSRILDIGTGNGEYLELALSKIDSKALNETTLTLVEPSDDLAVQLINRFSKLLSPNRVKIINSDLQTFKSDDTFDIVLMSHLFYHIPRNTWAQELSKALSLLKKDGILIIVLREKDDAYDFKMAFKPSLFDASFKALIIDDVLDALPDESLHIERLSSFSKLHIPFKTSMEDTISIVEFYLNKEWADIPLHIQQSSLDFIKKRKNVFKQVDGIAIISRGT